MNDISDHVTLVQPIDTSGNVNHVITIIGCWIYYYNYQISHPLIKQTLDIIFYQFQYGKEMYTEFKYVYNAVRYVNPKAKPENNE